MSSTITSTKLHALAAIGCAPANEVLHQRNFIYFSNYAMCRIPVGHPKEGNPDASICNATEGLDYYLIKGQKTKDPMDITGFIQTMKYQTKGKQSDFQATIYGFKGIRHGK